MLITLKGEVENFMMYVPYDTTLYHTNNKRTQLPSGKVDVINRNVSTVVYTACSRAYYDDLTCSSQNCNTMYLKVYLTFHSNKSKIVLISSMCNSQFNCKYYSCICPYFSLLNKI